MEIGAVAPNSLHAQFEKANFVGQKKENPVESFGSLLKGALGKVNDLQINSDKMMQTMITNPGKVNIHDVTTLMSQAEMALAFSKTVTDRVVNAYREITSLR